jgi:hypothetical protein
MFERHSRSGLALMFAPLYAGPVAAGWSTAPPATLVVFASVFFLIQLSFGRTKTKNSTSQVVALVFLALVQIGITLLTFGVGSGLAMLTGPLPLPVWFPLALTGCSAAIGALRYRHAQDDAAMLDLIDRTINTLETGTPFDNTAEQHPSDRIEQILASGDPADPAELTMLVETLLHENAPHSALPTLENLKDKAEQFPALIPLITHMQQERDSKPPQESHSE